MSRNVILVTIDCLRYDRCGFNGHHRETTPILDGLAHGSYIFDEAFATGPYTPESFPGLLAGLHDRDVSYYSELVWKALPEGTPTIASCLRDRGYETCATITNPHLTPERNFDIGFDRFRNLRDEQEGGFTDHERERNASQLSKSVYELLDTLRERARAQGDAALRPLYVLYRLRQLNGDWPSVMAEDVIDLFLADLDDALHAGEPVFAWTHLMDLHVPIHPSVLEQGSSSSLGSSMRALTWDSARLTNTESPGYELLYDAALRYVDSQISRLVHHLKERGVWDDTILIVTADHGEALFDRGVYGHPFHCMFDELLRVPLLVRSPSDGAGRIDSPFSLGWLHELVAELAGIDSFELPSTSGRRTHLDPTGENGANAVVSDSISTDGHTIAVRDGEHKYVAHHGNSPYDEQPLWGLVAPYLDGVAYHVRSDRGERHPLPSDMSPRGLRDTVEDYRRQPSTVPSVEGNLDERTEDLLRDLGYVT
jgi:choline-sulfatase